MRALAGLLVAATFTACAGPPEGPREPAPPRPPAATQAPPPATAPDRHPQGPPRPAPDEEATPVPDPLTVSELQRRAAEALGSRAIRTRLTPPLPAAWPEPQGRVVLLAYRREALPTGRIRYLVRPPRHAVEVDLGSGVARVLDLPDGPALGEVDSELGGGGWSGPEPDELAAAGQVLLDLVAGRRAPADARAELGAYARWLEAEPLVAADLQGRPLQAAFVAWLRGD